MVSERREILKREEIVSIEKRDLILLSRNTLRFSCLLRREYQFSNQHWEKKKTRRKILK